MLKLIYLRCKICVKKGIIVIAKRKPLWYNTSVFLALS